LIPLTWRVPFYYPTGNFIKIFSALEVLAVVYICVIMNIGSYVAIDKGNSKNPTNQNMNVNSRKFSHNMPPFDIRDDGLNLNIYTMVWKELASF